VNPGCFHINDATCDDAVATGIDRVATIFSSGTDAGPSLTHAVLNFWTCTIVRNVSSAKGRATTRPFPVRTGPFFLLKTKCPVIADDIGVGEGTTILKCGDIFHEDS